jgi:hypothetical protein
MYHAVMFDGVLHKSQPHSLVTRVTRKHATKTSGPPIDRAACMYEYVTLLRARYTKIKSKTCFF